MANYLTREGSTFGVTNFVEILLKCSIDIEVTNAVRRRCTSQPLPRNRDVKFSTLLLYHCSKTSFKCQRGVANQASDYKREGCWFASRSFYIIFFLFLYLYYNIHHIQYIYYYYYYFQTKNVYYYNFKTVHKIFVKYQRF